MSEVSVCYSDDMLSGVHLKMASLCARAVRQSYSLVAKSALSRAPPRLLCTASQQTKEEAEKPEQSAAETLLTEDKVRLEEQLKDMTEKYKRALADTENLRTRSQKMIEDAKLYGIQGFCKDLLEVADILEKATESVPKEEVTSQNPHLKNLYDGLVMTEIQVQKVFTKHGLSKLNPDGQKFDPYEHEALFHAPMEGKEPGTVAIVTKVGYKLHGRTLRPALVGVAKAP
ncbi:grpE protein homolog 1, mitochondrial [Eleginops maclovinus]